MPSLPHDNAPDAGACTRAASRSPTAMQAALACVALLAGGALFLAQGHAPLRTLQAAFLLLPGVLALLLPLRTRAARRLRPWLVTLWVGAFLLDGALRAFIAGAYQAAPDSGFVIGAVANSNWRESAEYARGAAPALAGWGAVLALALGAAAYLATFGRRAPDDAGRADMSRAAMPRAAMPRAAVLALGALLAVSAAGYAIKPWRKLHPLVFWSAWAGAAADLRDDWRHHDAKRLQAHGLARKLAPVVASGRPSTVVLVLGDSVNRDNMSLYGYQRPTTPALDALKRRLGDDMLVIRNAWSSDASTLPALEQLFALDKDNDNDSGGEDAHLLALARAAGYRTWWISNHDDIGIEQRHARLAEVVQTVNRSPGRSGGGLDEGLLDEVQAALDGPARRKFIVVHLLGAHPYYKLRYPAGADPFAPADAVDAGLAAAGRSGRVARLRKEYDAAVLYHDGVVARLLAMTQAAPRRDAQENRAWMMLSDHGQEVGHGADFAGHSPRTPAGYRIPALVWRNRPWPAAAELAGRPFRADWAGWTLADLLQLDWRGETGKYNVLGPDYAWDAALLPAEVREGVRLAMREPPRR
ncbi:phosphoethanolamine transferase [Massilia forsythiae]|uniref:Phosphoethanolamine transferase n=1 Tax=Massilia forsythiae TaxID=2728020 RepID=A0A7Z2W0E7_9BURK|nr:phosphoethanolamine transferase [Massilia forsythiae]QJE02460.1 phosphoethanolamine transferase [Massilia forsythiae]